MLRPNPNPNPNFNPNFNPNPNPNPNCTLCVKEELLRSIADSGHSEAVKIEISVGTTHTELCQTLTLNLTPTLGGRDSYRALS